MAATGTIQILGTITGLPGVGPVTIGPLVLSSTAAVGQRSSPLNLINGNNQIPVLAGTSGLIFIPPAGNANTITFKANDLAGTGTPLSKVLPFVLAFDPTNPPVAIQLVTNGVINGCEVIFI